MNVEREEAFSGLPTLIDILNVGKNIFSEQDVAFN